MEQVRNCQQVFGRFEDSRGFPLCSEQLIQRIDRHELYSGHPVDLFLADDLKDLLHDAMGARIAVMVRVLEQFPAISQQRIVDAPGVHADPLQFCLVQLSECPCHLPPQARNVPVQRTSVTYGLVGKSMDFLRPQGVCV